MTPLRGVHRLQLPEKEQNSFFLARYSASIFCILCVCSLFTKNCHKMPHKNTQLSFSVYTAPKTQLRKRKLSEKITHRGGYVPVIKRWYTKLKINLKGQNCAVKLRSLHVVQRNALKVKLCCEQNPIANIHEAFKGLNIRTPPIPNVSCLTFQA